MLNFIHVLLSFQPIMTYNIILIFAAVIPAIGLMICTSSMIMFLSAGLKVLQLYRQEKYKDIVT